MSQAVSEAASASAEAARSATAGLRQQAGQVGQDSAPTVAALTSSIRLRAGIDWCRPISGSQSGDCMQATSSMQETVSSASKGVSRPALLAAPCLMSCSSCFTAQTMYTCTLMFVSPSALHRCVTRSLVSSRAMSQAASQVQRLPKSPPHRLPAMRPHPRAVTALHLTPAAHQAHQHLSHISSSSSRMCQGGLQRVNQQAPSSRMQTRSKQVQEAALAVGKGGLGSRRGPASRHPTSKTLASRGPSSLKSPF